MADARTVVVTGAASGIGAETASAFAKQGDDVVIVDVDEQAARDTADTLPAEGGYVVETDVSSDTDVRRLATDVEERFGGADVLVNNAGVAQTPEPLADQSVEEWDEVVDVHLKGTYLCSKYFLQRMVEQRSGAVVNVSSIAGLGGFPERTAYGPAKSAINNLTQVLAMEGASEEVRVNAVAPGYVKTPLVEEGIESGDFDEEPILDRTPVGRMATPAEVADAITFLASEQASYVTGVVLPVDGGWTADGYV